MPTWDKVVKESESPNPIDLFKKYDANSHQGSQVQADVKQNFGFLDSQKILHQHQMTGTADGQKLGKTLDDTEKNRR